MSRMEPPELQLIELLRRSDAPSENDMQRVSDAIGVKLAVGLGASAAVLATTRSSWAMRLGMLGWGKSMLVASSLVGIGFGATWYAMPEALVPSAEDAKEFSPRGGMPETGVAVSELPLAESTDDEADLAKPDPAEAGPKNRVASSKTGRATPSTLEAEMELLGRAQRALKAGQPGEALRALDDHAKRFPSGVLALERSGVKTVALCQSGRVEEGRAAARSYRKLVPNSTLSKRIRIACQLSDE